MLKQRLWVSHDKAYYMDFLKNVEKYPGCCDEVWLSVQEGREPIEKLREFLRFLSPIVKAYRAAGIKVSVEIDAFGHRVRSADAYYDYSGVSGMTNESFSVDASGKTLYGQFCWNSEAWRAYRRASIRAICEELHPYAIYFDDDMRIVNWGGPVRCFCPICIKKFNGENKTKYTKEQLLKRFVSDREFRLTYIEFSYQGIAEYCFEMGKTMVETYADIHPGLQHGAYTGETFVRCFEALHLGSGNTVMSRSGGGGYSDSNPNELISKSYEDVYQLNKLPDYVEDRCNEVENYPRSFYSKTAYGICLETAMHLASGFNGASFAMSGVMEDLDLHVEVLRESSLRKAYWKRLVDVNRGGVRAGMTVFVPRNYWGGAGENWAIDPSRRGYHYNYVSIPITFAKPKSPVYILLEEYVDLLSEAEIDYLASQPVLLGGGALKKLCQRRSAKFFGGDAVRVDDASSYMESYTVHPINGNLKERGWGQSLWANEDYYIELGEKGESISVYKTIGKKLKGKSCLDGFSAAAILRTELDGKWLVQGYRAYDFVLTFGKKCQLENALEYIGGKPLIAKIVSKNRGMLIPVEKDGELLTVSVLNATIEEQRKLRVFVRTNKNVICCDEYGEKIEFGVEGTKSGKIVSIDALSAWKMITIFTEE